MRRDNTCSFAVQEHSSDPQAPQPEMYIQQLPLPPPASRKCVNHVDIRNKSSNRVGARVAHIRQPIMAPYGTLTYFHLRLREVSACHPPVSRNICISARHGIHRGWRGGGRRKSDRQTYIPRYCIAGIYRVVHSKQVNHCR